ncbi:MAG: hypothetical protein WCC10_06200 [Tumebacillaceae bacterium]
MKRRAVIFLFVLLLLFLGAVPPVAAAQPLQKRAVVVVIDGLRLSDLSPEQTPGLWRLQQNGALGVMNHNTLGAKNTVNSYLTIGAGTKTGVSLSSVAAYGVKERVGDEQRTVFGRDLYVRHTGQEPQGAIVATQLPQMLEASQRARYTVRPGALGDAVHDLGGRTAVLGNSDLGSEANRPAVLIAMDSSGQVDAGDLQAGLRIDQRWPYGMRTDVQALYDRYRAIRDKAQLIVLDTGDLLRWEAARDVMTKEQEDAARREALHEADNLVSLLVPEAGPDTMLMVLAPKKHPKAEEVALSPVIAAGGELGAGGLLSSGTTKRAGLVANYDIAPTLVRFFGGDVSRYPFLGEPATTVRGAGSDNHRVLSESTAQMQVISESRPLLVRPWLDLWIAFAIVLFAAQLFRRHWIPRLQAVAEVMAVVPLAWLFVPLFQPTSAGQTVLFSLGITLAIWLLLKGLRDRTARLAALAGGTALTIIVDVLLGAPLEKGSVLSYDPIAGARYYGIGNEYMGILLGSVILLLNSWFTLRPQHGARSRVLLSLLCLFVIYLFAAPQLGTNAGGALAAAVGFAYAGAMIGKLRMTYRSWLGIALATGGILAGMMVLNLFLSSNEQTHIGRATAQLFSGHFGEVYQIAARKVELNFLLLRVSAWGKLLFLFAALFAVWALQRRRSEWTARNSKTLGVAALAALLFNDSGVVAAALTLLYAVLPIVGPEPEASLETLGSEAEETLLHPQ